MGRKVSFEKHDTYDFSDIAKQGKIDSRPKGWIHQSILLF